MHFLSASFVFVFHCGKIRSREARRWETLHLICELGQGEGASDPRHTALTMSHDGPFLRNRIVCHRLRN